MNIKTIEFKIKKQSFEKVTLNIEPGELILISTKGRGVSSSLGIFSNFIKVDGIEYLCVAEQPYKFQSIILPSGISVPDFIPVYSAKYINQEARKINGWKYNFSAKWINEIVSGKDNILKRLREDPKKRYDDHADIIEKMTKPYITDPQIAERLCIEKNKSQ